VVALFCMPEGLLVNALKQALQHCSQNLRGAPPHRNLHLIFAKFSVAGANFLFQLYGDS